MFFFNPSNAEVIFVQSTRFFENHLNPVMLVLTGKLVAEYSQISTHMPGFR